MEDVDKGIKDQKKMLEDLGAISRQIVLAKEEVTKLLDERAILYAKVRKTIDPPSLDFLRLITKQDASSISRESRRGDVLLELEDRTPSNFELQKQLEEYNRAAKAEHKAFQAKMALVEANEAE